MWRRLAFPLSLVAAVTAAALAASSLSAAPVVPEQPAPPTSDVPYYAIGCSISHRSNDDPIVFSGRPGRSHNHTFIGNTTVDAWSTPGSLRGGPTSCSDPGDSSGYWVPTLYVGRMAVPPIAAIVFYAKRSNEAPATLPRRLKMIAGDAAAQRPQSKRIIAWSCGDTGAKPLFSVIPACQAEEGLRLQITFPSCWNSRTVDSRDHKRHMAYPSRGRCPASHPVPLPELALAMLYPPVPLGAQVASGRFGAHADFMNGWNDDVLSRIPLETR
jgi:hypothetical protein